MSLQFTGTITEIFPPRTGTTEKGEWASVEFEVTESNPENAQYPQIAKFDLFKNKEHVKYAKDFKDYYKIGEEVCVEFNLKKNKYTNANNEIVGFYKTSAWRIKKVSENNTSEPFEPAGELNQEEKDDLPF